MLRYRASGLQHMDLGVHNFTRNGRRSNNELSQHYPRAIVQTVLLFGTLEVIIPLNKAL